MISVIVYNLKSVSFEFFYLFFSMVYLTDTQNEYVLFNIKEQPYSSAKASRSNNLNVSGSNLATEINTINAFFSKKLVTHLGRLLKSKQFYRRLVWFRKLQNNCNGILLLLILKKVTKWFHSLCYYLLYFFFFESYLIYKHGCLLSPKTKLVSVEDLSESHFAYHILY